MTLRAVVGLNTCPSPTQTPLRRSVSPISRSSSSSSSAASASSSGNFSSVLPSIQSGNGRLGNNCSTPTQTPLRPVSPISRSSSTPAASASSSGNFSSVLPSFQSGNGRLGNGNSSQDGFVGSWLGGSAMRRLLKVRAQQSGAAEPGKADGALAFPSFSADDFFNWWSMRSRPNMDGYRQAPQRTVSEAERARAATVYLAYEAPASLAANPPWQISFPHVCVATIASVLFGYHLGVVNIPLGVISFDLGFAGNTIAQGSVVSACLVGAFFGSSVSGLVADKYGRRRAFQICTLPMIVGTILCATAPNLSTMLAGRFLAGTGLGVAGPATALYVSEISPTNVRGTLGSLCQVATCIGILGSILVGLPVSSIAGWWRVCFWIATFPAGFLAIAMEFCAESPRWLFKQAQWLEAEHELERLWGHAHAKGAMADLVRGDDDLGEAPWSALLDKKYVKVVFVGAALFAFQQLAGINAVFYFSSVVFRNAGVASEVAASVYMGIVNLGASLVAATLMDKKGRRSLMMWSFAGMGVAMALQAAAAGLSFLAPIQGPLSLFATLSYVFMFAIGAGPVPGLLLPEIFTSRIRGKAMSFAMCVHWIVNLMVGLFFLQLLQQVGPATLYSFFSVVCMFAVVFVNKNVQETKGRSLEEIEALLLSDL